MNFISTDTTGSFGTGSLAFPSATSVTITGITSSNTEVAISKDSSDGLNPRLYFKFVKSKLKPMEVKALKARLDALKKLISSAKDMGQQASFEELSRLLSVVIRESEAAVCGISKWVKREDIEKFKEKVTDKVIKFTKLEDFPRPIPKVPRDKIKNIKSKGLFDEYWILYVDYTKETIKTNKEKIREKDPIVFGKYKIEPNKLYFIVDWVDKYCDLTIDNLVSAIKLDDPEYELQEIPDINEDLIESIKKEVNDRVDRLNNTKPSNFRSLMEEEDGKKSGKEKETFFNKLIKFLKREKGVKNSM